MSYIDNDEAEIRQAVFEKARDTESGLGKLTNLNTGGVFRGLLELFAWAQNKTYEFLNSLLDQAFASTATGGWLDWHAYYVGITRQAAVNAIGIVVFSRSGTSGNVLIPTGTIVKTPLDSFGVEYSYATTADTVLPDGSSSVNVSITADLPGAAYNAGDATITEIVTPVDGVESVSNSSGWLTTAGADEEMDDSLRERISLRWSSISGVTAGAYESRAREVTGVIEAWVDQGWPRGRGTVDVYLTGSAGIPTSGLLTAVSDHVLDDEWQTATDDVNVLAPATVDIASISADVEAVPGYADATWLKTRCEEILSALFYQGTVSGVSPLKISEDFLLSRAAHELMKITDSVGIAPVRKVSFTSPSGDVAVPSGQLAVVSGGITATVTVASEI